MTTSTAQRAQHAIDSDTLLRLAADHARQLVDQRRKLDLAEKRVKSVLAQSMRDLGVTELTLGGEVVVRLTEFDRETVPVAELRTLYPNIAARLVNSSPVTRVDLP